MTVTGSRMPTVFKLFMDFLVARYATLHPALSVRPSVRRSVPLSVRPSHFTSLGFLRSMASLTALRNI